MVRSLHINCDVGEDDALGQLLPYDDLLPHISAVNIACGFHAGNPQLIAMITEKCIKYRVEIGLHPSYMDKKNFGRLIINEDPQKLYHDIIYQLSAGRAIVENCGGSVGHIKPHGALYNHTAENKQQCLAVYEAIKDTNPEWTVFGLPKTFHQEIAYEKEIAFKAEAFADRLYEDEKRLKNRSYKGAVFSDSKKVIQQIEEIQDGYINTEKAGIQSMHADTFCIHGDNEEVVNLLHDISNHFEIVKAK